MPTLYSIPNFGGSIPTIDGRKVCPYMSNPKDDEWMPCLQGDCQLWNSETENCGTSDVNRNKIWRHIHDAHFHINFSDEHTADNLDIEEGTGFLGRAPISIGKVSYLTQEITTEEDADRDGYVYMKDFYIKDLVNAPKILQELHKTPGLINRGHGITWEEYINWKDNGGPSPDELNSPSS